MGEVSFPPFLRVVADGADSLQVCHRDTGAGFM